MTVLPSSAAELPADSVLRRQAARMLMVGFTGNTIDDRSDAAHYVRDLRVGGIVLFDWDLTGARCAGSRNVTSPGQLKWLTERLQDYTGGEYRLLIAADQEGGSVCRMKERYGFTPTVSAQYLGEKDNRDTTLFYAGRIAKDMREAGVNVNLAPVLDVHNDDCPPLGKLGRCYSADGDVIARNAAWFVEAHHGEGVLCAAKHFPGHGSATSDSHYGLVDISRTWQQIELAPYQRLIDAGLLDMVMTAHVYNSQIDADYPSTLSHKTLTGLLREQMHFDGIIITDDLYMEGIIDRYPIDRALELAINAGADILLAGNNITTGFEPDRPDRLIEIIVNLVKTNRVPYSRILEANARIDRATKSLF